ncbi:MAG: hypothetical protein V1711_01705 [bacterium]
MNSRENSPEHRPQFEVKFIDDPEEYELLHAERGGGTLTGEGLSMLKPAFNSKDGLCIYKLTFESSEGYDPDFLDWTVAHEQMEYDLDMKTRTGNPDDIAELNKLGLPDKLEDEESFFRAIHDRALHNEVETAIAAGKDEAYAEYLEHYLAQVRDRIDSGDIVVSDEDWKRFSERQQERLRLLKELRKEE